MSGKVKKKKTIGQRIIKRLTYGLIFLVFFNYMFEWVLDTLLSDIKIFTFDITEFVKTVILTLTSIFGYVFLRGSRVKMEV